MKKLDAIQGITLRKLRITSFKIRFFKIFTKSIDFNINIEKNDILNKKIHN